MNHPAPITLATDRIELRPLTMSYLHAFHQAANVDSQWQWVRDNPCATVEQTRQWIQTALDGQKANNEVPFVIFDKASEQLIGSTRYLSIRHADKGLEIGHTWLNERFHRSYANASAKYLLLEHAFEALGAMRVEFKTHEKNQRSRNAIARIGAQFEGIMRKHRILPDGSVRNTAIFAMTDEDWPQAKVKLLQSVTRY